jgi:hypothetical protein
MRDDFIKYIVGTTPGNVHAVWAKYVRKWRSKGEVISSLDHTILLSIRFAVRFAVRFEC